MDGAQILSIQSTIRTTGMAGGLRTAMWAMTCFGPGDGRSLRLLAGCPHVGAGPAIQAGSGLPEIAAMARYTRAGYQLRLGLHDALCHLKRVRQTISQKQARWGEYKSPHLPVRFEQCDNRRLHLNGKQSERLTKPRREPGPRRADEDSTNSTARRRNAGAGVLLAGLK